MGNASTHHENPKCVFCDIVEEINIDTDNVLKRKKILKYNETIAILADIRPVSKHHYLVIPRFHIKNAKCLKGADHVELVDKMYQFGQEFLSSVATTDEVENALFGFHFPPFISVDHLHMHIISPSSTLSFIHSNLFRKNSWYFVSPEVLLNRLKQDI